MKKIILIVTMPICLAFAQIEDRLVAPLVAAHQGGLYKGRPNSLQQFADALKGPTDIIEMDLRLTKDQVVVVLHDEDLNGSTNCKGLVKDKTWSEVSKCKLNNSNQMVPSFESVLKLVAGKKIIDAEFKSKDVIITAIDLVTKYQALEWVYFQCKSDPDFYFMARGHNSTVALLYKASDDVELDWALSLADERLLIIELDDKMITKSNIKKVHLTNRLVRVNSWRFDKLQELGKAACNKVYKLGVHIAHTNRPESCAQQKNAYISP